MSPSLSSKHSINLHEPSLQTPCGPLFFSLSPQKMVLLFKFLVSTAKNFHCSQCCVYVHSAALFTSDDVNLLCWWEFFMCARGWMKKSETKGELELVAVEQHEHARHFVVEILGHKSLRLDWTLSQIGSSIIKRFSHFPVFCICVSGQHIKEWGHYDLSHRIYVKMNWFDLGLKDKKKKTTQLHMHKCTRSNCWPKGKEGKKMRLEMHYLRTFNPDFPEMELGGNMIFLFSTTSFLSSVILQIHGPCRVLPALY